MAKNNKTVCRKTGTPNKRTAIIENIEHMVLQEFKKIPAYIESLNNKEMLDRHPFYRCKKEKIIPELIKPSSNC